MSPRGAKRFLVTVAALALPGGFLTACAHPDRRPVPTAAAETRVGEVRAIGAEQRFVLVETASALAASAVSEGQLLHCRPPEALARIFTADLRVSRERHESLVVANVVAGQPAVGDIVYSTPAAVVATLAPAPGPIYAVPGAPQPGLFGPRNP